MTNPLSAQTISGYVTSADEEPLSGASIWLPAQETGTVTNHSGYFEISSPGDGYWVLVVRYLGYQTLEKTITLPEDAEKTLMITLELTIIQTEELLVSGKLFDRISRYQPTQTYTAVEIQQRNTSSIGTLLDGESGVAMRSMGHAPARPVVRGMDGERIQVLQNGMKVGDFSATGHDHAVIIDPATVDRVDIVRGPASLMYGSSAMGGIVNVHTGDIPNLWANGISGYFGAEGQSGTESLNGNLRLTHGSDNKAFTIRSSLRNTGNMQTPVGEIPGSDSRSTSLATGGTWRHANGFSGGSIQFTDKQYGIPEDPFNQDEEVKLAMQRISVQGVSHHKMERDFLEALEARIVYNYYTHEEVEYEYEDNKLINEDLELAIDHHFFQSDLLFQHGSHGWIDNGTAGMTFEWRDVSVGGDEALTPDARGITVAGYLIEEIRLPHNWNFQSGVRLEWNRIKAISNADFPAAGTVCNHGVWAASIGISGPLTRSLVAGIQLSRAHRTPSLEELFADAIHFAAGAYEVGDENLDNEVGYGLDLFMDYHSDRWQLHMALFGNRITNYISLRPTGNYEPDRGYPILEYYSSDAEILGGEALAKYNPTERWNLSLQADYIHGSELSDNSRQALPFMPPVRLSARTEYDIGKWWAAIGIRRVFTQNRTAESEEKTDEYTLTNASVGARLGTTGLHHITLSGDNLFDITWRDHLSRIEQRDIPMMGRNIRISYRYTF